MEEQKRTYASATAELLNNVNLRSREIVLDRRKMKEGRKMMMKVGDVVSLTPAKEWMKEIEERTVIYKTFNLNRRRMEEMTAEEIKELIKGMGEEHVFYKRGKRFGSIEIRFQTKEEAIRRAIEINTEKWSLWPIYCGERLTRIRIGGIPPEYEAEWIIGAIIIEEEKVKMIKVTKTENINMWGYGIEIIAHGNEGCINEIPQEIVLPSEERLRVIIDGRPAICDYCKGKGHLQMKCPEKINKKLEQRKLIETSVPVQEEKESEEREPIMEEFEVVGKRKRKNGTPEGRKKSKEAEGCSEKEGKRREKKQKEKEKENEQRAEEAKQETEEDRWIFVIYNKQAKEEEIEKMINEKRIVRVKLPKGEWDNSRGMIMSEQIFYKTNECLGEKLYRAGGEVDIRKMMSMISYEELQEIYKRQEKERTIRELREVARWGGV